MKVKYKKVLYRKIFKKHIRKSSVNDIYRGLPKAANSFHPANGAVNDGHLQKVAIREFSRKNAYGKVYELTIVDRTILPNPSIDTVDVCIFIKQAIKKAYSLTIRPLHLYSDGLQS